jgi:hypothetical protein
MDPGTPVYSQCTLYTVQICSYNQRSLTGHQRKAERDKIFTIEILNRINFLPKINCPFFHDVQTKIKSSALPVHSEIYFTFCFICEFIKIILFRTNPKHTHGLGPCLQSTAASRPWPCQRVQEPGLT